MHNDRNVLWHSALRTALGTVLIKDAAHRPNVGAECVGPWKTVLEPIQIFDGRKALLIPHPAKLFQAHHLSLLETTYRQ